MRENNTSMIRGDHIERIGGFGFEAGKNYLSITCGQSIDP